jgi:hypothetical protein
LGRPIVGIVERGDPMKRRIWTSLGVAVLISVACTATENDPPVTTADPASPSADTVVLSDCPELPCQGRLEPGSYRWEYRSTPSEPTIAFTIPSPGWTWYYSGSFRIVADTSPTIHDLYVADGVYFLRDPAIASQDCQETEEPGVGRSVADLVTWLEAAPGLNVSEPAPVTVGGLEGMQLDLRLDPAWERTCFFSEDLPAVPVVFSGAELGGYNWTMLPGIRVRWFILESADGVIIVDLEDDPGGLSYREILETGTEIIESLTFS